MHKLIAVLALALAGAAVAAAPAGAGGGNDGVLRSGNCSGAADWKLKAKHDDGRIETEFEVDQNVNGRRWRVVIRKNGRVVFNQIRRTRGPSGSFEVRRLLGNATGPDRIVARATALANGQTCRATVRV
jgi:hypothetical protein